MIFNDIQTLSNFLFLFLQYLHDQGITHRDLKVSLLLFSFYSVQMS